MLARTARGALADSSADPALIRKVDTIALVGASGWHPQNPVDLLAEKIGATPSAMYTTGIGGQVGITLTNHCAERIVSGRSEIALIGGCNNLRVLTKARVDGVQLAWARGGRGKAESIFGEEAGTCELEEGYGLTLPPEVYPLFENALRARLGLTLAQHRQRMGQLFSRFTRVAAENPFAWFSPGT